MIRDHRDAASPLNTKPFSQDNEVLHSHGRKVLQKKSGLPCCNFSVTLEMFVMSLRVLTSGAGIQDGCRQKHCTAKHPSRTSSSTQRAMLCSQGKCLF